MGFKVPPPMIYKKSLNQVVKSFFQPIITAMKCFVACKIESFHVAKVVTCG